jgi:hypothetical protein
MFRIKREFPDDLASIALNYTFCDRECE